MVAELGPKGLPNGINMAGKDVVRSQEATKEVFKFRTETKAALEKKGKLVVNLTGKSILDYKNNKSMLFQSPWHEGYPDFEESGSIKTEVAIDLKEIFYKNSFNKTPSQQEKVVDEYSKEVRTTFKGAKAVVGSAFESLEIVGIVSDKLNENGNGNENPFREKSARSITISPTCPKAKKGEGVIYFVDVGLLDAEKGILISGYDVGRARPNLGIIKMIVPEDYPEPEPAK